MDGDDDAAGVELLLAALGASVLRAGDLGVVAGSVVGGGAKVEVCAVYFGGGELLGEGGGWGVKFGVAASAGVGAGIHDR